EEYVDYLNKEISYYISHCLSIEMSEEDAIALNGLFTITGNIERMSDHATNIAGYASLLEEKGYKLSDKACDEIKEMIQVMNKATSYFIEKDNKDLSIRTAQAEQKIDDMTVQYRSNQLERMRTGVCSGEACVIYSEMLTDFERLGDHLFNIARAANANEINSLLPAEVQKI
nr:PhoU domain-containing protein [Saccharofermentans sp.]